MSTRHDDDLRYRHITWALEHNGDERIAGGHDLAEGDGISTVELEGPVDALSVDGMIVAHGAGATAVRLVRQAGPDLAGLRLEAPNGETLVSG